MTRCEICNNEFDWPPLYLVGHPFRPLCCDACLREANQKAVDAKARFEKSLQIADLANRRKLSLGV